MIFPFGEIGLPFRSPSVEPFKEGLVGTPAHARCQTGPFLEMKVPMAFFNCAPMTRILFFSLPASTGAAEEVEIRHKV